MIIGKLKKMYEVGDFGKFVVLLDVPEKKGLKLTIQTKNSFFVSEKVEKSYHYHDIVIALEIPICRGIKSLGEKTTHSELKEGDVFVRVSSLSLRTNQDGGKVTLYKKILNSKAPPTEEVIKINLRLAKKCLGIAKKKKMMKEREEKKRGDCF